MPPSASATAACACAEAPSRLRPWIGTSLPIAVVAVLPKCPLCLMAYGGIFATAEVSAVVASPLVAVGLVVIGLTLAVLYAWRVRSPLFALFAIVAMVAIVGEWRVLGLIVLALGSLIESLRRRRRACLPPAQTSAPSAKSPKDRSVHG